MPGARAQDATWTGATGVYNLGTNWDTGSVPTGTAFFGASGTNNLTFSNVATIVGGWTFNPGAANYTFAILPPDPNFLRFNGAGIVINGGSATITNLLGVFQFVNASSAGSASINNSSILSFFDTSSAGNAAITNTPAGSLNFNNSSTAGSAAITNNGNFNFNNISTAGSASVTNNNNLNFRNVSTAGNAAIENTGILNFNDNSTAGNAAIINRNVLNFNNSSTAGSASITNNSNMLFFGTSSAGSGSINNSPQAAAVFLQDSTAGNASITNNGTLTFDGRSTASSASIVNNRNMFFIFNSTGGNAAITNGSGALMDFSITIGPAGDGKLTAGSIAGAGFYRLGTNELTVGGNNMSTEVSGVVSGIGGSLVKVGTGTLTLSSANIYNGATTVNGGALIVNGSIASSSLTTVNSGASLIGSGTVGTTVVNAGGFLVPGPPGVPGTMTLAGNLAFQSGAFYVVQVNPTTASTTNVSGTASLAGTVGAVFLPGGFLSRSYTILTAAGGLTGTFDALTTAGLPPNFGTRLNYVGNTVVLNLMARLIPEPTPPPSGTTPPPSETTPPIPPVPGLPPLPEQPPPPLWPFTKNEINVGRAIDNFFNNGGPLPPAFGSLYFLTGGNLANALTQLSGEAATGIQPAANLSMSLFLNAMLDPFVTGHDGTFGTAMAYAPAEQSRAQRGAQDALAASLSVKAPPAHIDTFANRWSVWGSAYGGRNRIDGDPVVGSHDLSASTGGFAVGADYRVSPMLTLGAAVAIGETKWNTGSLGSGDSNLAQVGGYAAARWNSFYLSGAIAGAWHNVDTARTVTVAGIDRLTADFDATALGARVEGGWRHQLSGFGFTPYAAVQVQSVHTPAYSERGTGAFALTTGAFALTYASQTATDTRTELGLWADTRHMLSNGALVVLRGRAAWVHDFDPESRINAIFQTLPAASFTVDGAAGSRNAALASAVGELRLRNGLSLIAKFDGEFSDRAITYAGTGTVRYTW